MTIPIIPLCWMILGFICMLISFYFEGDKLWYWYFYIFAVIFMLFSLFFSLPDKPSKLNYKFSFLESVRAETFENTDIDVSPVFENSAWYDENEPSDDLSLLDETDQVSNDSSESVSDISEIDNNELRVIKYISILILCVLLLIVVR